MKHLGLNNISRSGSNIVLQNMMPPVEELYSFPSKLDQVNFQIIFVYGSGRYFYDVKDKIIKHIKLNGITEYFRSTVILSMMPPIKEIWHWPSKLDEVATQVTLILANHEKIIYPSD